MLAGGLRADRGAGLQLDRHLFGINGYGFGSSTWNSPMLGSTGAFDAFGFLVGGTVGANWQAGAFVFGIEGDLDWSNLKGTITSAAAACGVGCETKGDWVGTGRARVGWAWDRILFYGTGGAAFGSIQAAAGVLPFANAAKVGWTAGAGIEAAFAPNWTAWIEYLYDRSRQHVLRRRKLQCLASHHHRLAYRERRPRGRRLQIWLVIFP